MENVNLYEVRVNGNQLVMTDPNQKPCVRRCKSLAKKGLYVELWYNHPTKSFLVNFWN